MEKFERFNIGRLVASEGHIVVEAKDLKDKLTELASKVNEAIPLGFTVDIRRTGDTDFVFSIISEKNNIVVQQFGIKYEPDTKFVVWTAML
ncbi:hypothetical protein POP12_234 [Pectobacterium phage POP12]|nr:hypothetical protein POP12_234 [Pectobacterium phage POP12]